MAKTAPPPAPADLPVPSEWFVAVRQRAEAANHYDCLERSRPEIAARALWMLAQGSTKSAVAKALGITRNVVLRLSWAHHDTLETKRKEFSREYAMVAMEYKDLLLQKAEQLADDPEQLKSISPDKLAVTMGIATDKAAMLSGMAGVVIEHRKGASIDDAATAIAAAKARIAEKIKTRAIEAEVVGVEDCGY